MQVLESDVATGRYMPYMTGNGEQLSHYVCMPATISLWPVHVSFVLGLLRYALALIIFRPVCCHCCANAVDQFANISYLVLYKVQTLAFPVFNRVRPWVEEESRA